MKPKTLRVGRTYFIEDRHCSCLAKFREFRSNGVESLPAFDVVRWIRPPSGNAPVVIYAGSSKSVKPARMASQSQT